MPVIIDGKKKCNGCLEVKLVSEFQKEARAKNGYKTRCKICTNAYYNAKYISFRDNKINVVKSYYRKNKECIRTRQDELIDWKIKNIPEYRLHERYKLLPYRVKGVSAKNIATVLGYTFDEFLSHVGGPLVPGQSIDHKIPISWFCLETKPAIVHSLLNIQVLPVEENARKHNQYSHPISKEYFNLIISNIKPEYINKITI